MFTMRGGTLSATSERDALVIETIVMVRRSVTNA